MNFMKGVLVIILLLATGLKSYAQSQSIVGSWISADTVHKTQFFIKANGTVEKRTAMGSEDIWSKTPQKGTYIFKSNRMVIKWGNSTTETMQVQFTKGGAEFRAVDIKGELGKPELFLEIVDEVVPDK
jgi:hypothetical protein